MASFCLLWLWIGAEAAEDAPSPLRFRRIGVPADRLAEAADGKEKYLPLSAREFQRLLDRLHAPSGRGEATAGAEIRSAEYRAQLSDEGVLTGRVELEIRKSDQGAVFLPLSPCRLAVSKAWWSDPASPHPNPLPKGEGTSQSKTQPAIVGVDARGETGVLVERSGRLLGDWSLRGRQETGNRWEYLIAGPVCPVSKLTLELPDTLRPEAEAVAVDEQNEKVSSSSRRLTAAEDYVDSPAATVSRRLGNTWRIQWTGSAPLRLLLRECPAGRIVCQPVLRESRVYECTERGLSVSAQWRIRPSEQSCREVRVLMDPGLRLIAARYGDQEVPWTVSPLPDAQGERAVIALPRRLPAGGRILRLGAIAPLTLERSWRLPRLRPENLLWEDGEMILIVPAAFDLQELRPQDCRQTAVTSLGEPLPGESFQFQPFRAEATATIWLARRQSRLAAVTATTVEIGSGEVAAQVVVDVHSADALQLSQAAQIAPHWWIDAVESTPPQQVLDWSVESQSEETRRLRLDLARGSTSDRNWRLTFRARRLRVPGKNILRLEDLLPLHFAAPLSGRRLAAVKTTGPYELQVRREESAKCLALSELSPEELGLFAAPPGPLVFEEEASAAVELTLKKQRPQYAGSVRVEVFARENRLHETFALRCRPESGPLDRVLVRLFPAVPTPPRWTVAGEEGPSLSARRWTADEQAAAGWSDAGETWELTLRRPHPMPLEICGMRERAFTGPTPIVLASLPEASAEEGLAVLRSPAAAAVRIDNRGLKSLPPEPSPGPSVSRIRGVFRYDPARDVASAREPPLSVAPAAAPDVPPVFVWKGRLESWYSTSGATRHAARYVVQNSAAEALRFTLPEGVSREDLPGVWIDDQPAAWRTVPVRSADGASCGPVALSVPLPAKERPITVTLEYRSAPTPLKSVGRLTPPWCRPDVPLLDQSWTLWLPPGYEAVDKTADSQDFFRPIPPARRLFGPLERASPQGAFCGRDADRWTAAEVPLSDDDSTAVTYAYRSTWQLLGMTVFLATVGLVCWRAKKRAASPFSGIGLLIGGGILGLAALWIPEPFAPLATGGFLAVLFCVVLRIFPKKELMLISRVGSEEPTEKTVLTPFLPWFLMGAVLGCGGFLEAAETASAPPTVGEPFRVLVPIDQRKQPVGESVYLPEPLYRELYRRTAALAPQPQGWFLSGAEYEGTWIRESASGRVTLKSFGAEYTLRVFAGPARVRLPFRRDQVSPAPDGVTLDGQPALLRWEADGSAGVLEVRDPGKYRLRCALQPAVRSALGTYTAEVRVPPIASARWRLNFPAGTTGVEVPEALGRIEQGDRPSRLTAALGPVETLVVRWPESGRPETAAEVEEFLWLKVQPGAVVADARWKLRPGSRPVRRLSLRVESSWRLRRGPDAQAPAVQSAVLPDGRQEMTLEWPRPLTEEATVDLSFLRSGASGAGALRIPEIRLEKIRPVRRWLAVTLDRRLEYETGKGSGCLAPEGIPGDEFLKAWGAADTPPTLAYRLPAEEPEWILFLRPRPAEVRWEPTLNLLVGREAAEVIFDAEIITDAGYVFQHRIAAPPEWHVEGVSLRQEGSPRLRRWTRLPDGTLTLFLQGPADGKQQLQLRGILPLSSLGKDMSGSRRLTAAEKHGISPSAAVSRRLLNSTSSFQFSMKGPIQNAASRGVAEKEVCKFLLPRLQLESAPAETLSVQIYQAPGVRVKVSTPEAVEDETPPPHPEAAMRGRLVRAFRLDGASPAAVELTVSAVPQAQKEKVRREDAPHEKPHATSRAAALPRTAKVRLADVRLAWQADGTCQGVAEFDLDPAGRTTCSLRLPAELRLLSAAVDGTAALPQTGAAGRWQVPLHSAHLPQRITAVFQGRISEPSGPGERRFSAPVPGELAVEKTFWTLAGPPSLRPIPPDETPPKSEVQLAFRRLENLAAVQQTAARRLSDDPEESRRWYPPALRQWMACVAAARQSMVSLEKSPEGKAMQKRLAALEREHVDLVRRLGLDEIRKQILAESSPADAAAEWENLFPPRRSRIAFALKGSVPTLTLEYEQVSQPAAGSRIRATVLFLGGAVLAGWGWRRGLWSRLLRERPYSVAVACGLAWWCWFWPSLLGVVIVLLALLAKCRVWFQIRGGTP
ncbi:MAG: hypothetical protein JXB10_01195 [Pirellulales bacterium]|nr:hypothetical protein [Pirellulales bacterium]